MEILKNEEELIDVELIDVEFTPEELPIIIPIDLEEQSQEPSIKVIVPRHEVVFVLNDIPLYVEPLTEEETLVEVGTFNDYVKPLYDESIGDFIESATAEEIEIARPTPKITISETEKLWDVINYLMSDVIRK